MCKSRARAGALRTRGIPRSSSRARARWLKRLTDASARDAFAGGARGLLVGARIGETAHTGPAARTHALAGPERNAVAARAVVRLQAAVRVLLATARAPGNLTGSAHVSRGQCAACIGGAHQTAGAGARLARVAAAAATEVRDAYARVTVQAPGVRSAATSCSARTRNLTCNGWLASLAQRRLAANSGSAGVGLAPCLASRCTGRAARTGQDTAREQDVLKSAARHWELACWPGGGDASHAHPQPQAAVVGA